MTTVDVLLLGSTGHMGQLLAAELAGHGLSVGLAGRDKQSLEEVATRLPLDTANTETFLVDATDAQSVIEAVATATVVLSTIGPFSQSAETVVDACLAVGASYVDIANEWDAIRKLLDRTAQANDRGVTLISGAGFGVTATEALVLRLLADAATTPTRVRIAGVPAVATRSEGVAATIHEAMSQGAITYRDGHVVREPLGAGATTLSFGGMQRRMFPGPVGDLEAARAASGAPDVIAYVQDPSERGTGSASYAWAEVTWPDGRIDSAELQLGDGNRATAAIAAETTFRVLSEGGSGAWTPCGRFGPSLLTDVTNAQITMHAATA